MKLFPMYFFCLGRSCINWKVLNYRVMDKGYYHVYSFGEDTPKLLTNEREFVMAINILAFCAIKFNVKVMVFTFMNSHFHLVLYGDEDSCRRCGEELMRRLLRKINAAREKPYLFENVSVSFDLISGREELLSVMAYDIRNPIEAGFPMDPRFYQWGSASLYFAPRSSEGTLISEMRTREKQSRMGVYYDYPKDWTVSGNGAVSYRHFVDYQGVEALYGSVKAYIAFMYMKKDMILKMNMRCSKTDFEAMPDLELTAAAEDLSRKMFGVGVKSIDTVRKINLAQKIRASRLAGVKQLARVLGLDFRMLESVLP